jgi:hypothetical protein
MEGQVRVFISPRDRVAQLQPRTLGSPFVASYDSQGHGGGIRTRLHTGSTDSNYQSSLCSPDTECTENVSSIIAYSLVAVETCPQSCSLATAVVLSPVYIAVTWQWVYMSQYFSDQPRVKCHFLQLIPYPFCKGPEFSLLRDQIFPHNCKNKLHARGSTGLACVSIFLSEQ